MKKKKNIVRFILHTLVKKYKKFKDTKEKLCIYSLCSRNFQHFVSFLFPNFYNIALKLQTIVKKREKNIYFQQTIPGFNSYLQFHIDAKAKEKKTETIFSMLLFLLFQRPIYKFYVFQRFRIEYFHEFAHNCHKISLTLSANNFLNSLWVFSI